MKDNGTYFLCDCSGEVLRVERIEDKDIGDEYWFAIYRNGNWEMNLWNRIKYAWRVIFKGEAYRDQITLSEETVDKLKEYLDKE